MTNNESYIFGLLMTDGNLSLSDRNRGKVRLELSIKDKDIIDKLVELIPNSTFSERIRTTNFHNNYHSVIFRNSTIAFRTFLIENGFPTKNKTLNATVPTDAYSEIDFWRGVIDGDGSLGITNNNKPYISLATKSEGLKNAYCLFLHNHFNIEKNVNRNKRDNIYNIMVIGDKAVDIAKLLYLSNDESIHLNRKYQKALEMQNYIK